VYRISSLIVLCLSSLLAFGQSSTKYQVGTITAVEPHQLASSSNPDSYEVSVKVKDTVYVVLYTPPAGMDYIAKYSTGREILVLVREDSITYHDILGQSFEVPIISRTPAAAAKASQ